MVPRNNYRLLLTHSYPLIVGRMACYYMYQVYEFARSNGSGESSSVDYMHIVWENINNQISSASETEPH